MFGKAIFVTSDNDVTVKEITTQYEPDKHQLLIHVLYSGINPADMKHGWGLGINNTVAGYDFCGLVKKAGPGCRFQEGDLVAGSTPTGVGRPSYYGAHQDNLICFESMLVAVPESVPHEAAASLPVVVRTAADGIINHLGYSLDGASIEEKSPLLIWGAASSVGVSALQIAKACGASPIFVTASPSNHASLLKLGATKCFDYKSPTVVSDIRVAASETCANRPLRNAFDCIGLTGEPPNFSHMAPRAAACCAEDAKVVTVIAHPAFGSFVEASAMSEFPIVLKPAFLSGNSVTVPPRQDDAAKTMEFLTWAMTNYKEGKFIMPNITIVAGLDQAIQAIIKVAQGGAGFSKWVIKHPMDSINN